MSAERDGGDNTSGLMGAALGRRELLKSGAAIGAVGLLGNTAGCATVGRSTARDPHSLAATLDPAAVDHLLAGVDRRLAWINQQEDLPTHILPTSTRPRDDAFERQAAHTKRVVKRSFRSLYLTGCFIDLPDEIKTHPDVQARFASLRTEMDESVLEMTAALKKMTPDDHRATQRYLRSNPDFGEHLAKYLDTTATEDGLPFKRRFGARAGVLDLASRMRAQSPALVVDPIVSKVERLHARPRSDAEQIRLLSAKMGEEAFWAHQEKLAALQEAWAHRLSEHGQRSPSARGFADAVPTDGAVPPAPAPALEAPPPAAAPGGYIVYAPQTVTAQSPPQPEPEPPVRGASTVRAGGAMLGAGAGSILLGLGFWQLAEVTAVSAFYYPAVVLGITVGPILLVVGLIVLLIGAAIQVTA